MSDDVDIKLLTSVSIAGESTLATFKREIARCRKEECGLIIVPVDDLEKLLKVAEMAQAMVNIEMPITQGLRKAIIQLYSP